MASFFGELLFALVRTIIMSWIYSLWLKVGAWLDTKIHGKWTKIIVGGLLGLAAYILIPICAGLLGL
jgi:hypothetical protein